MFWCTCVVFFSLEVKLIQNGRRQKKKMKLKKPVTLVIELNMNLIFIQNLANSLRRNLLKFYTIR